MVGAKEDLLAAGCRVARINWIAPPPAAAEVDKQARKHVQPLLATLKTVRDEIDKIVAELKGG